MMTELELEMMKLYGRDEEFLRDSKEIPYIQFPAHWFVKMIGPFGGACARFCVSLRPGGDDSVSVYADFHERLGYCGGPYWEIYPDKDNNTYRCAIGDTNSLLKAIEESLQCRKEQE